MGIYTVESGRGSPFRAGIGGHWAGGMVWVLLLVCGTPQARPLTQESAPDMASATRSLQGITLQLCEDQDEWPPYLYQARENGKKSGKMVGYSVDVLDAIFSRYNIRYSIQFVPWVRCQKELKQGRSYQLAVNMSHNPERERDYLLTRSYYSTTSYYYYSRKLHPDGLRINTLADLKKYMVCGVHGYNYAIYGLNPAEVDQSAKKIPSLVAMLPLGRCDLFIEQLEILLGFGVLGEPVLNDPDLGREPLPGLPPTPFYMAISRNMPQAQALKTLLDTELGEMEASGKLRELFKKASSR